MRASNLSTFLLLPLLAAASPQPNDGAESSSSATTTLISTSTRTITHTMIQGTETLTSTFLSGSLVALTTSALSSPKANYASSLPDISAPSGIIDTTASLIVAPYPSSTPSGRLNPSSSVASLNTAAPAPSATGAKPVPFKGAASGRVGFGIAKMGAAAVGAMVLVGLV